MTLRMAVRYASVAKVMSGVSFVVIVYGCHGKGTTTMHAENPWYSRTDTTVLDLADSVWRQVLPDSVYAVARGKDTEAPFSGKYWDYDGIGTYYCAACGNPLFRSDAKFASACGWPSFFGTIRPNSVVYAPDTSYGMNRTEVLCGRCGAHLGHLFDDGPPPTGRRYCMNSIVLEFEPDTSSQERRGAGGG